MFRRSGIAALNLEKSRLHTSVSPASLSSRPRTLVGDPIGISPKTNATSSEYLPIIDMRAAKYCITHFGRLVRYYGGSKLRGSWNIGIL